MAETKIKNEKTRGFWQLWSRRKEPAMPYLVPDPRARNLNEILYQRSKKPQWEESVEGGVWIDGSKWEEKTE